MPLVAYDCPKCESRLNSLQGDAGRSIQCPDCGTSIIIPEKDLTNSGPAPLLPKATHLERKDIAEQRYHPGMLPPEDANSSTYETRQCEGNSRSKRVRWDDAGYSRRPRRKRKSSRVLPLACIGVAGLICSVAIILGSGHRRASAQSLPASVRKYIAHFEERDGSPARIVGVEYMAIKGKTRPTFEDSIQETARRLEEGVANGTVPHWPTTEEQRRMGNGGTSALDQKRLDKILKEMKERGELQDKTVRTPLPDLRVDGAFLVVFRRPVGVGLGDRENFYSRWAFVIRVNGGLDPYPEILFGEDWRGFVRSIVKDR